MTTRRRFLKWTGAGVTALWTAGQSLLSQEVGGGSANANLGNKRQTPFELGVASYTFRKFSLDEALAMTARVGIKKIALKSMHLPLDAKPDVAAQAVAKAKATGVAIYGAGVVTMKNPGQVQEAFDYAKTAGMRVIIGVPAVELLPLVNEKVQEYDIRVAIHNHGPGDKQYPKPGNAYEKIKGLDPRIGLCVDIGHTARIGDDVNKALEQYADRLLDIHIKDESLAAPEGTPLEVGRGVLDIPGALRTLLKIGYTGVVSFEYEKDPNDPLPGLAESVGYVRGVLATL